MEIGKPIALHFEYTFSDWIRGYRLYYSRTRRSFIEKMFALIMSAVGYFALSLHYLPYFGFFFRDLWDFIITIFWLPAAVIMWFDLASIAGIWTSFRRKKSQPAVIYDFTFNDEGARFQLAEQMDVRLAWSEFKEVRESKDTFLLMLKQDGRSYWTLPKQYFATADDIVQFRHLVTNKLFEKPKTTA
ncbi:MAG: YcxB family protein [Anaerolineae bacterium]|nr:YcxB family protein [Anaerolineae bacterium]